MSESGIKEFDALLFGCFTLQDVYGRSPESYEIINCLFHKILGSYQADKVISALREWLVKSPKFPTPADIVKTIQTNIEAAESANIQTLPAETLRRYKAMGIPLTPIQAQMLEAGAA